jgi:hypothetical protein
MANFAIRRVVRSTSGAYSTPTATYQRPSPIPARNSHVQHRPSTHAGLDVVVSRVRARGRCALVRSASVHLPVLPRALPAFGTRARAARSRPRTTRSTQPRWHRRARPTPRCATSTRRSRKQVGSPSAMADSTAPRMTASSAPCASGSSPIVGKGNGVSSFIHLDDAAAATVLALDHDGAGNYNIVDDEPARCANGCRCSRAPWARQAAPLRPSVAGVADRG